MSDTNETRSKVIRAAIDLFAARGFRGTSIRDIANAIDMSISNIYHHFGSKEGLLLAILEHASALLVDRLQQIADTSLDPVEKFKLLFTTHVQIAQEYQKEAKLFFLDEEHLEAEGKEINRMIQRRVLAIYVNQLKDIQKKGYLKKRNLTVLSFNILGLINWHMRWYRPEGALSLKETTEEILRFALFGMLGQPAKIR